MSVAFYRLEAGEWQDDAQNTHQGYDARLWRPGLATPFPPGRRDPRILTYTAMHLLGVFANCDYSMLSLHTPDGQIAHSSLVMPPFARFPFMAKNDLQIGATQTLPGYRGQGLAVAAIKEIMRQHGPDRTYWYLTGVENAPSISVIQKAGFVHAGTGDKFPRMGLRAIGYYDFYKKSKRPPSH